MKTMIYKTYYASPLGDIALESDGKDLTGLRFEYQSLDNGRGSVRDEGQGEFPGQEPDETLEDDWGQDPFSSPDYISGKKGEELPVFKETRQWLDRYFEGQDPGSAPSLRADGTPFQQTVWEILQAIPYGETRTYGEIAARIARLRGIRKMSAQAVGGAVSRNPISLIIPCHRVIGSDGNLTGYAGGLDRKEWLLSWEQSRCK